MFVFVHAQGIKTVVGGGGGPKRAKFCPRSCLMTPNATFSQSRNSHYVRTWIGFATISTNEITFFTSLEIGRLGQDQNTIAVQQVATIQ